MTVDVVFILLVLLWVYGGSTTALDYHAEHSIAATDYQAQFDEWSGKGYKLTLVTGFQDEQGTVRYNTIWHRNSKGDTWKSFHGMTESQYQRNFDQQTALGFYPVFVDGFSIREPPGTPTWGPRINVIYHHGATFDWQARHGQTGSQYQTTFDDLTARGYDLNVVSSYQLSGQQRLASIFSRFTNDNAWVARHGMTASQYQAAFDDMVVQKGYTLAYVSVGTIPGAEPRFAALFIQNNDSLVSLARHGVSDVTAVLDEVIPQGYVPVVIDAYQLQDGSLRWALLFYLIGEPFVDPEPNGDTYPETDCFDEIITNFMKDNDLPGAGLAVMKEGRICYAQGYGQRDVPGIGNQVEIRKAYMHTPFRLASVSKPVTSLAVLRLIQDGKLSLSDKVFGSAGILQFMSDNPKPCCPIVDNRIFDVTIEHLLTHTGGWDRDVSFDPMFRSDTISQTLGIAGPAHCSDIIYYMFGQNLDHEPGTTYAYSNFGYCILGRVIVQKTKKRLFGRRRRSYEQSVRDLFLDDAGVDRNEMYLGSTQLKDIPWYESEYYCPGSSLTDSVFPSETEQVPNPYGAWHLEAMDAHGAWVSSAPQLMKMLSYTAEPHCNGTLAGQNDRNCLLWQSSVDALTEKPSIYGSGDLTWYGLGFSVRSASEDTNWWHSGSLPGTRTVMVRTNENFGYAWAFLTNVRGFPGSIDSLMWDAVGCVEDSGGLWPADFELTSVPCAEVCRRRFIGRLRCLFRCIISRVRRSQ